MESDRRYYVYILTNKSNRVLYIGVTNNLVRRIFEHKNKLLEGFSKKYNLTKFVYYEVTNSIESAITREKQLKNWHRDWKINLINQVNPGWRDLGEELFEDAEAEASPEEMLKQVQHDGVEFEQRKRNIHEDAYPE